MIEFLIVLVVGDDHKPPWADPNPEIILIIISCVKGLYGPPSHFHKGEVRVDFVAGISVDVTEIMGQFR